MVLGSGAAAAALLRGLIAPRLGGVHAHRILIGDAVMFGMQRAYYLVVEYTLIIVHILCVVRVKAVKVLGQFGQVIGAAGLVDIGVGVYVAPVIGHDVGVHAQYLGVGLTEHLTVAHTAHGVGVAALHKAPEIVCQIVVVGVTVGPVRAQRTCYHGDMLVGMARTYVINVP